MSYLKGDWLLVTLQWEHWGGGQGWKRGELSPLNPSLIWTYFIVLCNIVNSQRNGVGTTLYSGAGRQHGACSETFWASCIMLFVFPGKDGRVTGRTESLPESQMDYAYFLSLLASLSLSLLYRSLETANVIDVAFFLRVAWEQRQCGSLACYNRHRSPTLSLSVLSSLFPCAPSTFLSSHGF